MNMMGRILAIVVGVALLVGILWLQSCNRERSAGAREGLARQEGKAAENTGRAATESVAQTADNAAATDRTVKDGTDAITSRPGGDSNDAADLATCRMRSYYNSERCRKLRELHSAPVAAAGSAR